MRTSVLLATTGRPDMAVATIESIAATTMGHDVEVVVAADVDEVPLPEVRVGFIYDYSPELRGASKAWNDALKLATGDPIVLAADDVEFQPAWLDAALEALSSLPDGWGFVGLNDGMHGSRLATHYMASRRLIVEHFGGVIVWPHYTHSFQDEEANARAALAGRRVFCENARIVHRHWLWGTRLMDETDNRTLGGHTMSERKFHERAAAGFPDDYPPAITE